MRREGFNLSAWGLRHGALVAFAMLLSLMLGALAYFQLGRAEDPNLTIKVMTIDVAWPGATTRDLEQQVVEKISRTLQEVPSFDYVQSYVRPGQATIFLVLHDSTRKAGTRRASASAIYATPCRKTSRGRSSMMTLVIPSAPFTLSMPMASMTCG